MAKLMCLGRMLGCSVTCPRCVLGFEYEQTSLLQVRVRLVSLGLLWLVYSNYPVPSPPYQRLQRLQRLKEHWWPFSSQLNAKNPSTSYRGRRALSWKQIFNAGICIVNGHPAPVCCWIGERRSHELSDHSSLKAQLQE